MCTPEMIEFKRWMGEFLSKTWLPAWNAHDGNWISSLMHPKGTFSDPFCGTLGVGELPVYVELLHQISRDHRFEIHWNWVNYVEEGDTRSASYRWTLVGHSREHGNEFTLPGCDFFKYSKNSAAIVEVHRHFCVEMFKTITTTGSWKPGFVPSRVRPRKRSRKQSKL